MPFDLSEGDVLTIFSQFGEPVHLNLVRDKETGKSRGFAFLKYEDQRSTDLAVDNLSGTAVLGRVIRVDHTRYKRREEEGLEDNLVALEAQAEAEAESGKKRSRSPEDEPPKIERPLLKEEKELWRLIEKHDDEDPMKEFLIQEKKEEVTTALERYDKSSRRNRSPDRHRHRHHHRHNHRRSSDRDGAGSDRHRRRSRSRSAERRSRDKESHSKRRR